MKYSLNFVFKTFNFIFSEIHTIDKNIVGARKMLHNYDAIYYKNYQILQ